MNGCKLIIDLLDISGADQFVPFCCGLRNRGLSAGNTGFIPGSTWHAHPRHVNSDG